MTAKDAKSKNSKDVDMKDAKNEKSDKKEKAKDEEKPKDPDTVLFEELSLIINRFTRGVTSDFTELARGVRQMNKFRGKLNNKVLGRLVRLFVSPNFRDRLIAYGKIIYSDKTEGESMDVDSAEGEAGSPPKAILPESFVFLQLLVSVDLLDATKYKEAVRSLHQLIDYMRELNRRTLDLFSAKTYSFYSLAFYKLGQLPMIRVYLLAWFRTACLQHNEPAQASLINLLLQNYLYENLYTQADKFERRTDFPSTASSEEMARNFYYIGRIKLYQLQYSDALASIQQAMQKAPNKGALGFVQAVTKSLVLTKLLMGDIPELTFFAGDREGMRRCLFPYKQLTQAVRNGDLGLFAKTTEQYAELFKKDKNMPLIVRLRHNVIKLGLIKVNLAYSRISMQDVCDRLRGATARSDKLLKSAEDAEYIVAKAIRDGVIDAVIERGENGEAILCSKENPDVYNTHEPYHELNRRVQFCFKVHDDSVKAMRYPEDEEDEEKPVKKVDKAKDEEEEAKTVEEVMDMDDDDE